jgi:hypothetical protein
MSSSATRCGNIDDWRSCGAPGPLHKLHEEFIASFVTSPSTIPLNCPV